MQYNDGRVTCRTVYVYGSNGGIEFISTPPNVSRITAQAVRSKEVIVNQEIDQSFDTDFVKVFKLAGTTGAGTPIASQVGDVIKGAAAAVAAKALTITFPYDLPVGTAFRPVFSNAIAEQQLGSNIYYMSATGKTQKLPILTDGAAGTADIYLVNPSQNELLQKSVRIQATTVKGNQVELTGTNIPLDGVKGNVLGKVILSKDNATPFLSTKGLKANDLSFVITGQNIATSTITVEDPDSLLKTTAASSTVSATAYIVPQVGFTNLSNSKPYGYGVLTSLTATVTGNDADTDYIVRIFSENGA